MNEATGFSFNLKAEAEKFIVIAVIHSENQSIEIKSEFATIEQARQCFTAHEKTAEKSGCVRVFYDNLIHPMAKWRRPESDA